MERVPAAGIEDRATLTFPEQLAEKVELVNGGVAAFAAEFRELASGDGPEALESAESYLSLLERGGKRIRGVLLETGYTMFGGEPNPAVVARAGGAIEAIHAHLLVLDDVADGSNMRRGDLAAHRRMEQYLAGMDSSVNARRIGEHSAMMASQAAYQKAQTDLWQLEVPDEQVRTAAIVLNDGLRTTSWGQNLDLLAAARPGLPEDDIKKIAMYKTAIYSFGIPLQVGAALAGASLQEVQAVSRYALCAGMAYQLYDDVMGLFGDEQVTGKPRMSDIIEGKQTLLFRRALAGAEGDEYHALLEAHGNPRVTDEQFARVLHIIERTGALRSVVSQAEEYAFQAVQDIALQADTANWQTQEVRFLQDIAMAGVNRAK